jgi:hypothetical protein
MVCGQIKRVPNPEKKKKKKILCRLRVSSHMSPKTRAEGFRRASLVLRCATDCDLLVHRVAVPSGRVPCNSTQRRQRQMKRLQTTRADRAEQL